MVYFVRFFLGKIPTVAMLSALGIPALGIESGIHPGVVLLTILMSIEGWFLLYQNDSYQIVYYSTNGRSFSHGQARKLMLVRFLATFVATAASIPYWRFLGLME